MKYSWFLLIFHSFLFFFFFLFLFILFSRGHATLHLAVSIRRSVGPSVRRSHFLIPSGCGNTAPAQAPATGLPCIRPCSSRGEICPKDLVTKWYNLKLQSLANPYRDAAAILSSFDFNLGQPNNFFFNFNFIRKSTRHRALSIIVLRFCHRWNASCRHAWRIPASRASPGLHFGFSSSTSSGCFSSAMA